MGNTLKLEDLLKPDCVPDESAGGENWRILHGDTLKLVKGFQPGIFGCSYNRSALCVRGNQAERTQPNYQPEVQQHESRKCPAGF